MTNTMNTPIEEIERSYPLLVKQYELRPESSGLGQFRGGSGIVRSYQAIVDGITVTILAERGRNRPRGLFGGGPGTPTIVTLYKKDRARTQRIRLPVKTRIVLGKGDIIQISTAGGGGYGELKTRARSRIRADIENGLVSPGSQPREPSNAERNSVSDKPADL
jgi:N-methylhydantoinase B